MLLHMLGRLKPAMIEKMTGKNLPWIIDTGATNHMMGMLRAFVI